MTKKVITTSLVAGAMLTLIGCGGGSSSDIGSNTDPIGSSPTIGTGYYVDAAVKGLSYTCGSETGTTGDGGKFSFEVGQSCIFKVGDIELPEVAADALKDGAKFVVKDEKTAQFLQTLDKAGDGTIEITPKLIEILKNKDLVEIPENEEGFKALVALLEEAAQEDEKFEFTGEYVTAAQAAAHVAQTKEDVEAEVAADNAVFTVPSTYYMIEEDSYWNGQEEVNGFESEVITITETKFSFAKYMFNGNTFVADEEDDRVEYHLKNGQWVMEDSNGLAVSLSEDKKVMELDGKHQLTFTSIRNLEGTEVTIQDSTVKATMPKDAELITWEHKVLEDDYGIDEKASNYGAEGIIVYFSSLQEVIENQCGNRYFNSVDKEGVDIDGIAFDCNDAGKNSGNLIGVKRDSSEFVAGVGTWEIVTLPNSDLQAIVTNIEPAYNEYNDSPLFAMNDGEVWRGWHSKAGITEEMTMYNKVAYDAFEAHLKALVPTEFTQDVVSANPWYIVETEDAAGMVYCNGVFTMDGNNNLTVSWNDPGDSGSATGTYSIVDGKFITSHDGKTETETLLAAENGTIFTEKLSVYDDGSASVLGNKKWYKNKMDAEAYLSTHGVSSCF